MACTNRNCPAYGKCLTLYRGSRCKEIRESYGLGDPLTNADRIRSMSDEELAAWINNACRAAVENHQLKEYEPSMFISPDGDGGWLDWLRQEATD